jgi:hypothetical protein
MARRRSRGAVEGTHFEGPLFEGPLWRDASRGTPPSRTLADCLLVLFAVRGFPPAVVPALVERVEDGDAGAAHAAQRRAVVDPSRRLRAERRRRRRRLGHLVAESGERDRRMLDVRAACSGLRAPRRGSRASPRPKGLSAAAPGRRPPSVGGAGPSLRSRRPLQHRNPRLCFESSRARRRALGGGAKSSGRPVNGAARAVEAPGSGLNDPKSPMRLSGSTAGPREDGGASRALRHS